MSDEGRVWELESWGAGGQGQEQPVAASGLPSAELDFQPAWKWVLHLSHSAPRDGALITMRLIPHRQLLAHFHCLSCDRPLETPVTGQ